MNTHQRRQRLVTLLRAVEATSVEQLADDLDVSARTIRRDLHALRDMDFPVETERGRGGGVRMLPYGAMSSVRFTVEEAVGLWVSLSMAKKLAPFPMHRAAHDGMQRILAALPPPRRREVRALLRRVVVAQPATRQVAASAGEVSPTVLDAFEQAFTRKQLLQFTYVDAKGQGSRRQVQPHGILVQVPVWYVLAYDVDKQATRSFRTDRMQRAVAVENSRFLPRDDEVIDPLVQPVLAQAQR